MNRRESLLFIVGLIRESSFVFAGNLNISPIFGEEEPNEDKLIGLLLPLPVWNYFIRSSTEMETPAFSRGERRVIRKVAEWKYETFLGDNFHFPDFPPSLLHLHLSL